MSCFINWEYGRGGPELKDGDFRSAFTSPKTKKKPDGAIKSRLNCVRGRNNILKRLLVRVQSFLDPAHARACSNEGEWTRLCQQECPHGAPGGVRHPGCGNIEVTP